MKRKKFAAVIIIALCTLWLVACFQEDSIQVAMVVSTKEGNFFQELVEGAQIGAEEMDHSLEVYYSNNRSDLEYEHIEELIEDQVDVIIINPVNSDAVYPAVQLANNAGIPVITVDRASTGGEVVSHITSDNVSGGRQAATYIIEQLGNQGEYGELMGLQGTSAAKQRGQGFNDVMIDDSQMTLTATLVADFDRVKGYEATKQLLEVQPDLKAIFAHNDEMALGAIQAMKEADLSLLIVGFDGIDEALKALAEGDLAATIAQQPKQMGSLAFITAIQHVKGQEVDKLIMVDVKLISQ